MSTRGSEHVRFESSTGPRLAGIVDLPQGRTRGWGVFAHGFTLGKDCPAAARICRQLAERGIGMLRFDALGLGDSEGCWGDGSFTVKVADVAAAVAFMASRGTPAELLVGHSWGGAAAIAAAVDVPSVRAVATIAAPSDPSHVEHHYQAHVDRAILDGEVEWLVGGRVLTLKRQFVEDVRRARILDRVAELGRPLLVMHSPTDATVDVSHAGRIFQAARHPRSFVSLEDADHLLTRAGRAQRAGRLISTWAGPYLSSRAPSRLPADHK